MVLSTMFITSDSRTLFRMTNSFRSISSSLTSSLHFFDIAYVCASAMVAMARGNTIRVGCFSAHSSHDAVNMGSSPILQICIYKFVLQVCVFTFVVLQMWVQRYVLTIKGFPVLGWSIVSVSLAHSPNECSNTVFLVVLYRRQNRMCLPRAFAARHTMIIAS